MTPFYLNPPSSLPHGEGNQSQEHLLITPETLTSSSSCPIYFNSAQEEGNCDEHHHHQHHHKHESTTRFWTVESGETTSVPTMDNHYYNRSCIKPSRICKREDQYSDPCDNAPVNWMASNMRLMRKMVNSDRRVTSNKLISDAQTCSNKMRSRSWDHEKSNNSTNSVIRVCADCNTTKTPLWRSGPRGPKSLCNACGIRHRKARRALANGGVVPTDDRSMSNKESKEKQSESHCTTQQKKRFKRTKNKLRLEDFAISLSKSSAFHPQDERDAAILLMALSYGLVCS